ncbi:ABC transporter ATP-binding protein [Defluviimonas sp. 20V17]|uniref:ABC transporter ATP-binding protein n=1 Tax=Allgaiera indica TaxID=765699 RepID=A0AAN5A1G5_9RHOB|nr:ABC transporter ATP-binding protein [Allgaiera indica]KDB04239.1 ABC transporter ATP-binding protein [Defluviimonas sp. 20V17]GHE06430.1 ABC transporter ATP-binding protein [Allgaiera indica]SDX92569.1 carbohydrate ABC transporter ATP-binding protein, CUT1 family [Allgaiera indica]
MALELSGVEKTVAGRPHIHRTDLRLEKGTMNVLLGATLSGKTTLMRLMAGLEAPSVGRILWDGRDVTGMRVQDRNVAMVYQQFINYPSMSVYDNIASPLMLTRRPRAEIDRAVRATAEMLQLTPLLQRRPLELSGGQQQRCALARALVKGAGLVLLDEPLANLDYKLREELRQEIPKIFEASGAIFVYATTEPEEALLLGGRTATLWQGRVTQFGPTPDVYRRPKDAITARVFSDPPMNFLEVVKTGGRLRFADPTHGGGAGGGGGADQLVFAAMAGLADGPYTLGFRANHLRLSDPGPGALRFATRVAVTEITGSETFVHLDHGPSRWVALVHGVRDLAPGAAQPAFVDPAQVYAFGPDGALAATAAYATAA